VAAHPGIRPNAWVAGIPVLFVVVAILGGLVGFGAASPATAEWLAEDPGRSIASFAGLRQCFGEADSAFVLLLASLVGSFVAAALALTRRTVPGAEGSSRTASRDLGLLAAAFAGLAAVSLLAFGGLLREEHPPWTAAYWASATEGPALAALAAVLVGGLVLVAALLGLRMAAERRAGRAIHALSLSDVGGAWMAGARSMALAAGILILAWSIQQVCKDLGTGIYMVAALRGAFDPGWLPAATFLAAAAIAFATGTSWATMGILIPTVLPLAHRLGGEELAVIATAAVLDGAIFGDHCSPISDTTVLSSIASRCDHLDHVRTQLPYAATCMIAALVAGYLPSAFGYHGPLCYVAALGMLALALWGIGRRVPDPPVGTGQ
jgi:hypothetical protein